MRKFSANMVPRIFSGDQKQWQLDVCSDFCRQLAEGNHFLDRIITGDAFSTIRKRNAKACNGKQRHRDQKKKMERMSRDQVKTMLNAQSIPEEEFHKYFEQWKHRLIKYIGEQGDYFEGDSNH
jgi:hypothetical protein